MYEKKAHDFLTLERQAASHPTENSGVLELVMNECAGGGLVSYSKHRINCSKLKLVICLELGS